MFKQKLTETPFYNSEADLILGNINGSFTDDSSFISTLRALLGKRIPEEQKVYLRVSKYYGTATAAAVCDYMPAEENCIELFEKVGVDFETVDKFVTKNYPKWVRVPKITEFYRKAFPVACYVNYETKSAFILTRTLETAEFRYLQCSIPVFLPWYFEGENALKEADMRLIESLTKKTAADYLECLNEMAREYDFEKSFIKRLLGGFETRADRAICERSENKINDIVREINTLNRKIGMLLAQKSQEETNLLGLRTKIEKNGENSEIEDYFLSNRCVSLVSASDREINFICTADAEYFDSEMVESVLQNPSSYIYDKRGKRDGISSGDMAKLIREIFINGRLKLRMCAAYKVSLNGAVLGQIDYDYGFRGEGCLPNPHIDKYACLGNYHRTINECLLEHDYISAIEQCVASCKSLNFGDYTVMDTFMDKMYRGTQKCIVLPSGETVTIKKAVEWLNAEGENESEQAD